MEKLNPCPFCGSHDVEFNSSRHSVVCNNCETFGPSFTNKEEAELAWNLRATKEEETK